MVSAPKAPAAPDPKTTAAAQAGMNIDTAQATQLTNMTNQITPDGSLTYNKTGENSYVDSQGKTVNIPMYTATQTLSPENQQIYQTNLATQQNISDIGKNQSAKIGDLLGTNMKLHDTPVDLSNEAVEARLYDLGSKRLNPQFAQQEEGLRTRLANSGIRAGSAAYDAEMRQFNEGRNDAYNQLLLSGRGQSVNEILSARNQTNQETLAERNQPINEISALLSGSQVSQPNFVNTPQANVGGVDYTGMVRDKYNADMQAYQAKVGQQNAMMGGLFGLAAAPFSAMRFSDRRLKSDIKRVGSLDNGLPIYAYRMNGENATQIGLMADEVASAKPEAVTMHPSGFQMVDYAQAVEAM